MLYSLRVWPLKPKLYSETLTWIRLDTNGIWNFISFWVWCPGIQDEPSAEDADVTGESHALRLVPWHWLVFFVLLELLGFLTNVCLPCMRKQCHVDYVNRVQYIGMTTQVYMVWGQVTVCSLHENLTVCAIWGGGGWCCSTHTGWDGARWWAGAGSGSRGARHWAHCSLAFDVHFLTKHMTLL